MKRYTLYLLAFLLFTIGQFPIRGQAYFYLDGPSYPFLSIEHNKIVFPWGEREFEERFLAGLGEITRDGNKQIGVLHIGDSHVQADFFTGTVRALLQTEFHASPAGRGFIFPYRVAGTNNPNNYKVESSGQWVTSRNIDKNQNQALGLAGYSVSTHDSGAWINLRLTDQSLFNRVELYHHPRVIAEIPGFTMIKTLQLADSFQISRYESQLYVDTLTIFPVLPVGHTRSFELFGLNLTTRDGGILYHATGVNGAKVDSYLAGGIIPGQLREINPDLVVISLGTNDTYNERFLPQVFYQRLDSLVLLTRTALPGIPIVLTTPGDHYFGRKYLNPRTLLANEQIWALALARGLGVWDFHTVMGGEGSIAQWQRSGLAANDRVHLTREGYRLQGELFFKALVRAYDEYHVRKIEANRIKEPNGID